MSTHSTDREHGEAQTSTRWKLDPSRSTVEFRVRHFWGRSAASGGSDRFDASLSVSPDGTRQIELTIDADSIHTDRARRDTHLRAADFFHVSDHPQVRFRSP